MTEHATLTDPAPLPASSVNTFVVGVDLASQHDFTALCVIRSTNVPTAPRVPIETVLDLVHLERWRQLPYPKTVDRILERFDAVRGMEARSRAELVVDATGVGLPVLHMLQERYPRALGVLIHGGDTEQVTGKVHRVPKRNLVGHLQVVLQAERLRIARELPLSGVLAAELTGFKVKIGLTGHDRYGNEVGEAMWREQDHDDLVLATALAVWRLERPRPKRPPATSYSMQNFS